MKPLPRTVWLLGGVSLLSDVGSELVFPLLPALLASMGAAPWWIGVVEGCADTLAALLKYLSGLRADGGRRNRPWVIGGYALASLTRPLFALATAPVQVLGLRVLDRVGKGVRTAPRDLLLARAAPPGEEGRVFGLHQAMDHTGAVLGPLVGWALLQAGLGVREAIACAVVPSLLTVLLATRLEEPEAPSEVPPHASSPFVVRESEPFSPELKRLLLAVACFALANSTDGFLLARAREVGVAEGQIPLLWWLLSVSMVGFTALGGRLADRLPPARLVGLGWLLYAGCYLGFGLANAAWQVWGLMFIYGAFHGLAVPGQKALVKRLAAKAHQGRAFGAFHAAQGGLAIPAGLLTGLTWSAYGAAWALGLSAALATVAALLVSTVGGGGKARSA